MLYTAGAKVVVNTPGHMKARGWSKNRKLIGVISDTHGLIRPEALRALDGADLIIHAGDIGKPEVVAVLRSIAQVIAIRGNNDRGPWARKFPATAVVKTAGVKIFVVHDLKEMKLDPKAAGCRVVISGHSHSPSMVERDGVLFLNPGSAGPRRFKLPVAVAMLRVEGSSFEAEIVELKS
jgi:putative phosphoesterase